MNKLKLGAASKGFTIVELLIVIVVIGILAAITIVAYTGITSQANQNAAKANANSLLDASNSAYAMTGTYPALSGTSPNHTFTVTQDGVTVKSPTGLSISSGSLNNATSNTVVVYARNSANTGVCIGVAPTSGATQVYYGGTATTIGSTWNTASTATAVTCT